MAMVMMVLVLVLLVMVVVVVVVMRVVFGGRWRGGWMCRARITLQPAEGGQRRGVG